MMIFGGMIRNESILPITAYFLLGGVMLLAYRKISRYYANYFIESYQGREDSRDYLEHLVRIRRFTIFREERWLITMRLIWGHYLAGEFDLALSEIEFGRTLQMKQEVIRRLVFTKLDGGKHTFTGTANEMLDKMLVEIHIEKEFRNI